MNENRRNNQRRKKKFTIAMISVLVGLVVFGISYLVISGPLAETNASAINKITDNRTVDTLYEVEVTKDVYTMEWLSDSMDRGNHDLNTSIHGKLVISPYVETYLMGMMVHYQHNNEDHIGRLVGMPGDVIEIRNGHVYLNDALLDTFYGAARSYGLTKDEYFEVANPENVNLTVMEEYFNQSMDPITVAEDSYFILVDTWWRGKDSKDFGVISQEQIQGEVIGYEQ